MNTIDSTKLIELANADYDMLKEKGKEGEKVLHYNGYLDGFATGCNIGKKDIIDKACDAYCQVCGHYPHKVPTHICRQDCDYYMKFRKAMSNPPEFEGIKTFKSYEELNEYLKKLDEKED